MSIPIELREGFEQSHQHPLVRALREVVRQHKLTGAVLISFFGDRVGVNSSSPSPIFGRAMEELGDRILQMIDDGVLDPSHEH